MHEYWTSPASTPCPTGTLIKIETSPFAACLYDLVHCDIALVYHGWFVDILSWLLKLTDSLLSKNVADESV